MVDTDNSGFIEFKEFLDILKNRESESKIFEFFKSLTKGKLIKDANLLPFTLVVNNYRRKMLIDAVTSDVPERKTKGEKVMKAYISSLKSDK